MLVKFGPAGMGGIKEAISNLEKYKSLGFTACEIAFTYGAYIKKKEDAEKIKEASERLGIQLSIHGPYWVNLNSEDPEKIIKSKDVTKTPAMRMPKIGSENKVNGISKIWKPYHMSAPYLPITEYGSHGKPELKIPLSLYISAWAK